MTPRPLDQADIAFEPPLRQRPRRGYREAILLREDGALFTGIRVHLRKCSSPRVDIPEELHSTNRAEWGTRTVRLTALQQDTLRERILDLLTGPLEGELHFNW